MTDHCREALVEKAAKALYEANWGDDFTFQEDRDYWVSQARAALAVFEQATAPTDDEREALATILGEPVRGTLVLADRILAAGFRRTVQGERAARPHCDGCAKFAHHHCYHCGKRAGLPHATFCPNYVEAPEPQGEPTPVRFVARQAGKAQSTIDALLAQANEHGIRVEVVYPQGEPTDAQDWEALGQAEGEKNADNFMAGWRAALRAAAAIQEGENHGNDS